MSNMSYCRFTNTRADLYDCLDALRRDESRFPLDGGGDKATGAPRWGAPVVRYAAAPSAGKASSNQSSSPRPRLART